MKTDKLYIYILLILDTNNNLQSASLTDSKEYFFMIFVALRNDKFIIILKETYTYNAFYGFPRAGEL